MGNNVGIGQSLIITGFSMVVVFLVLTLISILISGLKKIGEDKEVVKKEMQSSRVDTKLVEEDKKDIINDEELVAVISAAIAANMGISIPELNIKKIKRMPQTTPTWAVASRQEKTSGIL